MSTNPEPKRHVRYIIMDKGDYFNPTEKEEQNNLTRQREGGTWIQEGSGRGKRGSIKYGERK